MLRPFTSSSRAGGRERISGAAVLKEPFLYASVFRLHAARPNRSR